MLMSVYNGLLVNSTGSRTVLSQKSVYRSAVVLLILRQHTVLKIWTWYCESTYSIVFGRGRTYQDWRGVVEAAAAEIQFVKRAKLRTHVKSFVLVALAVKCLVKTLYDLERHVQSILVQSR